MRVALGRQVAEQRFGRGQRVQADGMGHLMRAAGVGGQDQRQLPVRRRGRGETVPVPARGPPRRRCGRDRRGGRSGRIADRGRACRGDLKLTRPAKRRPSTSGSTTCMARSAGDRPRSDAAQSRRRAVDSATWNTGQSRARRRAWPPSGPCAEKAVALTMADGRVCGQMRAQPVRDARAPSGWGAKAP